MTIKNIQEITGLSRTTISRVLNGRAKEYRIADETARKIFDAARSFNYRPNIVARSLRLGMTTTIGLIVPDIQNPFFGELGSNIERLLRLEGYLTILCNTNEIPDNEEFYIRLLFDRRVDGIIIVPIQMEEWDYLVLMNKEIPVVLLDRIFLKTELPWVTSNNVLGAEKLTEELINRGCKKIAYLVGRPNTYINTMRFTGYKNIFEKYSLEIDNDLVLFSGYTYRDGEKMMEQLIRQNLTFDALFCVNNLVFHGVLEVMQDSMYESFSSLTMAAFDVDGYCDFLPCPVISANQNTMRLAESSVSILLDKIHNHKCNHNQLVLPISFNKSCFQ